MTTSQRLRAANSLRAARAREIRALYPNPVKHKMTVIEGIPGMTSKVVYLYRGHTITRTYRTYDSRNKHHKGYYWSADVENGWHKHTREDAKAAIDRSVAEKEASPQQ